MKELAEYKEWFITARYEALTALNPIDTPKEQETPSASKEKHRKGKVIGTIFKANNEPTDKNYLKLFKSILFKLNASDRAKDSDSLEYKTSKGDVISGHVTISTAKESYNWEDGDVDKFTRTVRPSHLPEVDKLDADVLGDFAINTINGNPKDTIEINKTEKKDSNNNLLRALYTVRLNFNFLSWIKDIVSKTKDYIDTYVLHGGVVTISNVDPNEISITDTPATNVASKQHEVNLRLFISDNSDLSADRVDVPVSERAIREHVLNAINSAGHLTISQLNTELTAYYTQTEVDNLLDIERTRITDLESRVAVLENFINIILPDTYYTKIETDNLLDDKADINHNHDTTYHPLVASGLNGDLTLQRLSQATVQDGILINFNT